MATNEMQYLLCEQYSWESLPRWWDIEFIYWEQFKAVYGTVPNPASCAIYSYPHASKLFRNFCFSTLPKVFYRFSPTALNILLNQNQRSF